jgi:hypothetical protein
MAAHSITQPTPESVAKLTKHHSFNATVTQGPRREKGAILNKLTALILWALPTYVWPAMRVP